MHVFRRNGMCLSRHELDTHNSKIPSLKYKNLCRPKITMSNYVKTVFWGLLSLAIKLTIGTKSHAQIFNEVSLTSLFWQWMLVTWTKLICDMALPNILVVLFELVVERLHFEAVNRFKVKPFWISFRKVACLWFTLIQRPTNLFYCPLWGHCKVSLDWRQMIELVCGEEVKMGLYLTHIANRVPSLKGKWVAYILYSRIHSVLWLLSLSRVMSYAYCLTDLSS